MSDPKELACSIQERLKICYTILHEYRWLTNAYILDFFVENYWDKLLESWSCFIDRLPLVGLADILDADTSVHCCQNTVLPLSLNCLRILLRNKCLPRNCITAESNDEKEFYANERLMNLFWKNVKVKKRHEIMEMAKLCSSTALKSNCFYIVDVGSGLGHLSRILAYGFKFNVLSIEANNDLTEQAKKLDWKFKKCAIKYLNDDIGKIEYVNSRIDCHTSGDTIIELFKSRFGLKSNISFGLVGLHPCGDLGALLLKLYKNCDNIKFINMASCCYMKLATPTSSLDDSFPMSSYCKINKFTLSYNDREIACHAIEMYIDKLKFGQHDELKIHAYRAALEKIISTHWPDLCHSHLSNIKYREDLKFEEYCNKAVVKLGIRIKDESARSESAQRNLTQWSRVVKFYTLRLMLAPLIETIILLDRLLYMQEIGGTNEIVPAFQPRVSPRNHILKGIKEFLY